MILDDLQTASYRGVEFFFDAVETIGGKNTIVKRIPGSDKQIVEELGTNPRGYRFKGCISGDPGDPTSTSYVEMRRAFLRALERRGSAALIHPIEGKIEDVYCARYKVREGLRHLGDAKVDVVFLIGQATGLPEETVYTYEGIDNIAFNVVIPALKQEFTDNGNVLTNLMNTVTNARETALAFVNDAKEQFKSIAQPTIDTVTEVNLFLEDTVDDIGTLIETPEEMVEMVTGTFQQLNDYAVGVPKLGTDLARDARGAYLVMANLFGFGEDRPTLGNNTYAQQESNRYNSLYDYIVQCCALCHAYVIAAEIEYDNTDELISIEQNLEDQYQDVVDKANELDVADDSLCGLFDLRTAVREFFTDTKITTNKIIEIETDPIPASVLAYKYYGSSELGDAIAKLNEDVQAIDVNPLPDEYEEKAAKVYTLDSSELSGIVKILTE